MINKKLQKRVLQIKVKYTDKSRCQQIVKVILVQTQMTNASSII